MRALSPHIGARTELEGRRVLVWRARVEGGRFVPIEVQPEGGRRMGYDEWLRGLRAVAPARRAAYEVVLRVFEDDAYADRAFASAAAGLDARDRALAQQIAYGTVQRVRALDHGIETLGRRPVRKLDPRCARRSVSARTSSRTSAECRCTRPSTSRSSSSAAARLERAVPFTNAVMRRLTGRAARRCSRRSPRGR